jgi:hypothetical protein
MDGHAFRIAQSMPAGMNTQDPRAARHDAAPRARPQRGVGQRLIVGIVAGILALLVVATALVILAPVMVPLFAN